MEAIDILNTNLSNDQSVKKAHAEDFKELIKEIKMTTNSYQFRVIKNLFVDGLSYEQIANNMCKPISKLKATVYSLCLKIDGERTMFIRKIDIVNVLESRKSSDQSKKKKYEKAFTLLMDYLAISLTKRLFDFVVIKYRQGRTDDEVADILCVPLDIVNTFMFTILAQIILEIEEIQFRKAGL
jgi:DNA-directed RNA polymerase specialized sigma24 family protein